MITAPGPLTITTETMVGAAGYVNASDLESRRKAIDAFLALIGDACDGGVPMPALHRRTPVEDLDRVERNLGAAMDYMAAVVELGTELPSITIERRDENVLVLRWDGTSTQGRWVEVTMTSDYAIFGWNSGTSRSSTFLDIANRLAGVIAQDWNLDEQAAA